MDIKDTNQRLEHGIRFVPPPISASSEISQKDCHHIPQLPT